MVLDAGFRERAVAAGVPVDGEYPSKWWVACVADTSAVEPTDSELAQVRSYVEYACTRWADPRALKLELPVDPGVNTVVLRKGATMVSRNTAARRETVHPGWAYRKATWDMGPRFLPPPGGQERYGFGGGDPSLVDVLDRALRHGSTEPDPHWEEWKAQHPEVFPVPETGSACVGD